MEPTAGAPATPIVRTKPYFAPSPLNADHAHLAAQIALVEEHAGALHLDFMDGHFVPTLAFAPAVVRDLKRVTMLPLRCHLMVSDPDQFIDTFADFGADLIIAHAESQSSRSAIRHARERGMKTGVALKLDTPVSAVEDQLDELDSVLIMSIVPGRSGQPFRDEALHRIEEARRLIDGRGLPIDVEVDGGVNEETGRRCVAAGASVLAADTVVFKSDDPNGAARRMATIARGE
jgi:ribulose-phosphate 3-epimerase